MDVNSYAAGLIDGEGSITLTKSRASVPYRRPGVTVASTTRELVDFMKDNFGGSITKKKTYQAHHLPSYHWQVYNEGALRLLEQISNYLLEPKKKARAKYLLDQYKGVTPRNGKYTPAMKEAKLLFEEEFNNL